MKSIIRTALGYVIVCLILVGCGGTPGASPGETQQRWAHKSERTDQTSESGGVSQQIRYEMIIRYTGSLSERNCIDINAGQSFNVNTKVENVGQVQLVGALYWTEVYNVLGYNPSTDEIEISMSGMTTKLVRAQPNNMPIELQGTTPWGDVLNFTGVRDYFIFSGISGDNPNQACFAFVSSGYTLVAANSNR